MGEFRMPSLGADMDSGTIVEWRIKPGDTVHHGDIVAVVDTSKSDIEVEVFEDGIVDELLVEVGREVAVGTPLAVLTPLTAGAAQTVTPSPPVAPAEPAPPPTARPVEVARPAARPRRRRARVAGHTSASPLARRRAAEQGVDLASLTGTGPGGAVLAADVPATRQAPAAEAPTPAPGVARDRREAMRRAIGELMARSKREIPHYYLASTIDLSTATAWLTEQNLRRSVLDRLLPVALLLKATARAAREVPTMNGFWIDGFQASAAVHLGVAVSLRGGGLIAPAIHDADGLSLDETMAALRDLVERARAGRLRSSEMSDPTITVTNLGEQGAEEVQGVIYPPQVALVGFGRVIERPWATGGMLGVRPTVRATLAADHRVTDGHEGSRYLAAIERLLQRPEEL